MSTSPITDFDLHAYVDNQLDPLRRASVEAALASDPALADQVRDYRRLNAALTRIYPGETTPAATRRAPRRWLQAAAVAGWLVLGGGAGWFGHAALGPAAAPLQASERLVEHALAAHAVYTPEVRHPVEVGASEQAHLVGWLTKRLGTSVRTPDLAPLGLELLGGRLLPDGHRPAAQFMYQDSSGRRVTLYVRPGSADGDTGFRYASRDGISAFYWVDGELAYALIGGLERPALDAVARRVYEQLSL